MFPTFYGSPEGSEVFATQCAFVDRRRQPRDGGELKKSLTMKIPKIHFIDSLHMYQIVLLSKTEKD